MTNTKQTYARLRADKDRILECCEDADEASGIYILTRECERGFKYAYIGQAKHLLTRLAEHLNGFQHIDLSLKRHGLYCKDNRPFGWKVGVMHYPEYQLNALEQALIKEFAVAGYQLRNKTSGGQNGTSGLDCDRKPTKNYYEGLQRGFEKARAKVKKWFERLAFDYADFLKCGNPSQKAENAFEQFSQFLSTREQGVEGG